jgi:hypothetical protein
LGRDGEPFSSSRATNATKRARASSRVSCYFAWGCFRDFVSGPFAAPPKRRCARGHEVVSARAYGNNGKLPIPMPAPPLAVVADAMSISLADESRAS